MSAFDFVSHESFPEDEYTKEAVTLCFDGKYRVTYVRKKLQNGGMFWGEVSTSVKVNGEKKFIKGFSQDSNFLQEDIRAFLDSRAWEKGSRGHGGSVHHGSTAGGYVAQSQKIEDNDAIPF
jgi:hypothetical protein